MKGSFMGRGNQCVQLLKVLYCKLPAIGKQLQTFPHGVLGLNCRLQTWEASVLPLHCCGHLVGSNFIPSKTKDTVENHKI